MSFEAAATCAPPAHAPAACERCGVRPRACARRLSRYLTCFKADVDADRRERKAHAARPSHKVETDGRPRALKKRRSTAAPVIQHKTPRHPSSAPPAPLPAPAPSPRAASPDRSIRTWRADDVEARKLEAFNRKTDAEQKEAAIKRTYRSRRGVSHQPVPRRPVNGHRLWVVSHLSLKFRVS
jgi:hypothetical protein